MRLPASFQNLIEHLRDLPSLGPRQATRLAFFLTGIGRQTAQDLLQDLSHLEHIKICARCFFIHSNEGEICEICADPRRRGDTIMIVEKETDLISMEETGKYPGTYFIVGHIPKTGLLGATQKKRIAALREMIKKEYGGQIEELVVAFNPSSIGDFQASLLAQELAGCAKKISRLGRGLPTGGEIEFADAETLAAALDTRR